MNDIPSPYVNGTYLVVNGVKVVVTDHVPHAESWRYEGHPVALTGGAVYFSHHQAAPVPPRGLAPTARGLLAHAGLDPEQFDHELSFVVEVEEPKTALEELVAAAIAVIHSGPHRIPDLRGAVLRFQEEGA